MFRLILLFACVVCGWAPSVACEPPGPPPSSDVAVVFEFGGLDGAFDSPLGVGVRRLANVSAANLMPDLYDSLRTLWRELDLEPVAGELLARRAAYVALRDGSWAIASELEVARSLEFVQRLGATPRGIGARGALLSLAGGKYTAVLRSGLSIEGEPDDQLATLIIAPESAGELVRVLSEKLLGGAGFAPQGGEDDGSAWVRGFVRIDLAGGREGFASLEARAGRRAWRASARVSRALIAPRRPATLEGLDQQAFDRLTSGAAVGIAGIIDEQLARRTPVLGAIVELLPPEHVEEIEGRPAVIAVFVDDDRDRRRATLLTLVRTDAAPDQIDRAVAGAATRLGLVEQEPGFDGFCPGAERVTSIDGPTRALVEPVVGAPTTLRWARLRDDGWWGLRLGSDVPGASDTLVSARQTLSEPADVDARALSFGVVSPRLIATSPRAAGVMPEDLSDAFARVGQIRWRTWLADDNVVGLEMVLSGP